MYHLCTSDSIGACPNGLLNCSKRGCIWKCRWIEYLRPSRGAPIGPRLYVSPTSRCVALYPLISSMGGAPCAECSSRLLQRHDHYRMGMASHHTNKANVRLRMLFALLERRKSSVHLAQAMVHYVVYMLTKLQHMHGLHHVRGPEPTAEPSCQIGSCGGAIRERALGALLRTCYCAGSHFGNDALPGYVCLSD
ncbi:hypothetical protein DENSPDRAFT_163712 [Dentipellis sp. KUC8613]|nr:hypothetical protein DENSPDRAFT_163712 [Dentipellis sp. KUC8613]